jgi:fibronectin type 3 domain-containing protein
MTFLRATPPPAVEEMIAVANPEGIELRWQALEKVIAGGYHVYRRAKEEKTAKRINPEIIKETSYLDRQVKPGKTYYYSVSVIGGPPGFLEGQRSRETGLTYNP